MQASNYKKLPKLTTKSEKNAPAWRDEHNQSLVDGALVAKGKVGNSPAEQIRARLKRKNKCN